MALRPCSFHGARVETKLSNVTWAWNRADHERIAYRQYLCVECFVRNVAGLEPDPTEMRLICPVCHSDSHEDLDPVYVTMFLPGTGKLSWELALDGPCAVEVRNRAQQGAERLDNREPGSVGAAGGPYTDPATLPWQQLGIGVRDRE